MNDYRVYLEWKDNGIHWNANVTLEAFDIEHVVRIVKEQTKHMLNVRIRSIVQESCHVSI